MNLKEMISDVIKLSEGSQLDTVHDSYDGHGCDKRKL
jgi:hypothetical protein